MPVNDGSNIRLTPLQPMRLPDMAREASTLLTAMRRASGGGGEGKGAKLFNPVTKQFEFIPGGSEKEREANLQRLIASQLAGAFTDGKTDASKSINAKLKKFGESSVERQAQIIEDIRRNDIPALAQQTGIDGQLFTDGPLGNLVEQQKNNAKAVDKTGAFDIFWDSIRRGGRTFADGLADIFSDSQEQMARANARQEYFKELEAENAYLRNRTRRQEEGAGFLDRLSGGEVLASMGEFLGQNAPTLAATVAGGALGAGLAGAAGTSVRAGSILGQMVPGAITGAGGQIGAVGDAIMSDPNLTDAQKQQALADAKAPAALFGGALGATVLPVGQMARRGLSNLRANMGRGSSNVAEVVRAQRAGEAIPNGALTWEDALSNARRADMLAENEIIRGDLGGRWRQQMADSMLEGMGFSGLGQVGTNALTGNDLTENLGSAIAGGAFGGMLFTPVNRRTPYSDAQIPAERVAPEVLALEGPGPSAVSTPVRFQDMWQRPGVDDMGAVPPFGSRDGSRPVPPDAGGYDVTNLYNADNAARYGLPDYRQGEFTTGWSDLTNRYGSQRGVGLPTGYGEFGPEWGYYNFAENATDAFNRAPGSTAYWNQGAWAGPMERPIVNTVMGLPPSDGTPSGVRYRVSLDELSQPTPSVRSVITPEYIPIAGDSTGPATPMRNYSEVNSYPFYPPATAESNLPGVVSRASFGESAPVFHFPPLPPADNIVMGTRESGRGPIPAGMDRSSTGRAPIATPAEPASTASTLRTRTKHLANDLMNAGGLKLNSMPRAQYMEQARAYIDDAVRNMSEADLVPLYGELQKNPKKLSKVRKELKDYAFDRVDERIRGIGGEVTNASAGNATPAVRSPEATASVGQNDTRGAEGIAPANNGNDSGSPANAGVVVAPAPATPAGSVDADGQPAQKRGDARTETQGAGEAEKVEGTPAAKTPTVRTADGEPSPESTATADAEGGEGTGVNGSSGSARTGNGRNATDTGSYEQSGNVLGDGDGSLANILGSNSFFQELMNATGGDPTRAIVTPPRDARSQMEAVQNAYDIIGMNEQVLRNPEEGYLISAHESELPAYTAAFVIKEKDNLSDMLSRTIWNRDARQRFAKAAEDGDYTWVAEYNNMIRGTSLAEAAGFSGDIRMRALAERGFPDIRHDPLDIWRYRDRASDADLAKAYERWEATHPEGKEAFWPQGDALEASVYGRHNPFDRAHIRNKIQELQQAREAALNDDATARDAVVIDVEGRSADDKAVLETLNAVMKQDAETPSVVSTTAETQAVPTVSRLDADVSTFMSSKTPEQLETLLRPAIPANSRVLKTKGKVDTAKVAAYMQDAGLRTAVSNYVASKGLSPEQARWAQPSNKTKTYQKLAKIMGISDSPTLEPYRQETLDNYISSPYPARKNMDDAVSMLKEGPTGAKQRLLELTDLGYCTITGR